MSFTDEDRALLERCVSVARSMSGLLNVPLRDVRRLEVLQARLSASDETDLGEVAARIKVMLLSRAGEAITPELAEERANNIAQAWPALGSGR